METLTETLMVRENPRNCCRRTKHQFRAVVNSTTDKPPAQGVHDSNHEGFMTLERCCRYGSRCRAGKAMRTDKTPGHGVHGCDHEPLMTAPRPLMSEVARRYLTQR
jgi:hypothetical protein